MTNFFRR